MGDLYIGNSEKSRRMNAIYYRESLYRLKYSAPFSPFRIITKDNCCHSIRRPQDLAFPPDRRGLVFVVWQGGEGTVVRFSDVSLLERTPVNNGLYPEGPIPF